MRYLPNTDNIPANANLYIYGSGARATALLRQIHARRSDLSVLGFIDSYAAGHTHGLLVERFDQFLTRAPSFDYIVIASVHWNEIEESLRGAGISNYFIFTECRHGEGYQVSASDAALYQERFAAARALLETERDQKLYDLIWELRQTNPRTSTYDQLLRDSLKPYFKISNHYLDFLNRDAIQNVIDGGVEEGVNLRDFLRLFPNNCRIYGFEPNYSPAGGSQLSEWVKKNIGRLEIQPLALWDCETELNFRVSGASSRIEEDAGASDKRNFAANNTAQIISVKTTSIDSFVAGANIKNLSFIKLDVEGAEPRVINGARHTLLNHRPQLAISIYHSISDFIELPLQLSSLCPDYIFHLGHYSDGLSETVFYAIPRELCR